MPNPGKEEDKMQSIYSKLSPKQAEIVHSLVDVGGMWARQGLSMGVSAVKGQAQLLRTVSDTLDRAAEVMAEAAKATEAKKDEPKADAQVVETTAVSVN
ncbi:MAG: hypothetical protein HY902_07975 [Deltaproteobacteria bacterium]|nr:hypothetical protein [Deltaproteobacteria bacterium]